MSSSQSKNRNTEIVEFINYRFNEYVSSEWFQNWKLLCENIRDAVNQKWRAGEQMTRSGFYFASLRATRDGFKEGFTDTFGQAKPLFVYKKRRGVDDTLATLAQETMEDVWEDMDGLSSWLALTDDAIDYGMGVAYTSWCKYSDEVEAPIVTQQSWGHAIEWQDEFNILLDQAHLARVHPFNYRSDSRRGSNLQWEGCEWEWTLEDLMALEGNPQYIQDALKRVIDKAAKGELPNQSKDYYNTVDATGGLAANAIKVYAKEYWGDLRGVKGLERDPYEYTIIEVAGEIIRHNVNRIHVKQRYRPFKRVRLSPNNDVPIGNHILAPNLPHSRLKNLMLNLSADDILMRQHLGLAVKRSALENPNDLLNPEGARGIVYMKSASGVNDIPRFFADGRSGVFQDAAQFNDQMLDRDMQMSGIPNQALGMNGGGAQNQTATGQRFLASNSNRKSRSAIMWSVETGLKPIGKDIMLLTMRHRPPDGLNMAPDQLAQLWANNFWGAGDAVTIDQVEQNMALANFGQMAMSTMQQITTPDGRATHVIKYMKDLGKAMRIPTSRLDEYFPEGMPPQVNTIPPPAGGGQPPPQDPNSPTQAPMSFESNTEEEMANEMA